MEEASLRDILLLHGRRYPLMMPQDAVKLLYQSTFGPGHLITHKEQARTRLLEEYMLTPSGPPVAWEPIGNGLGRVYLGALLPEDLDPLLDAFIRTAQEFQGEMPLFLQYLALLEAMAEAKLLPFSLAALENYLLRYRQEGCPMVSHSHTYRQAYAPAYRVVSRALWQQTHTLQGDIL